MEYKLIRSNRKTLKVKVTQDCQVIVLAPNKCSKDFIENFIKQKEQLIYKSVQLQEQNNKIMISYINYSKVLLFGKTYDVIDKLNHYEIANYYIKHKNSNNKAKIIKEFLIKISNDYLIERINFIANKLNLKFKDVKIISARRVWGSCNNLKEIRLNFRLIMLPENMIDYVISHELCHLIELNHSKNFWCLLNKLGYDKKDIKQQFSNYAFVLRLL